MRQRYGEIMPRRSPEYMDGQRRRFCEAAIRCFRSQGVVATNLAVICEKAGLSIGAFYKLFRSREELLEAVMLMQFQHRNELLHGKTWSDLKARILEYRGEIERLSFWRELEAIADWNEPMKRIRLEQGQAIIDQFEHQLAVFAARGEIRPVLPLSQTAQLVTIIFDGSRIPLRETRLLHISLRDLGFYLDFAVGAIRPPVQVLHKR